LRYRLLNTQEECYSRLRLVDNLGYIVQCYFSQTHDSGFYNIIVQSAKCHPYQIITSIKKFLNSFYEAVINSNKLKERFSIALKSAKDFLKSSHESQAELSFRVWKGIAKGNLTYNPRLLQFKSIDRVTIKRFQHFYHDMFLDQLSMKVLTAIIYGEGRKTEVNADCEIVYHKIHPTLSELDSACA